MCSVSACPSTQHIRSYKLDKIIRLEDEGEATSRISSSSTRGADEENCSQYIGENEIVLNIVNHIYISGDMDSWGKADGDEEKSGQ